MQQSVLAKLNKMKQPSVSGLGIQLLITSLHPDGSVSSIVNGSATTQQAMLDKLNKMETTSVNRLQLLSPPRWSGIVNH